ncbi:alpha/beta hydrolase-fold protein [Pedobacter cryoconitis]|uniref:Esterase n=1 Tax=Pedobacter cryoconitis TaxID=188932 RepID=A0A7X0J0U1_9SPHI|nr:alpha/beta hydrolase-fold protein [Pedobacter cryoconitis]MBB6498609.1 hypothetical protein [Pedobacter cryoconitis]
MNKYLIILILALTAIHVNGQNNNIPVNIGHVDTLYSTVLHEKRPLWIYTPPVDTSYFSRPAFPVLYVLDGESYFLSLNVILNQLGVINGNTILPHMIIVGILNTPGNRTRDLTPSKSEVFKNSGGGEDFTLFLRNELLPYIDKNYTTAPYRTIFGHSLGGLMVINTLINHNSLFNAYIAIDPSMSYDNDKLLGQTESLPDHRNIKNAVLFLGVANTMKPGIDTLSVRQDTTQLTHHIRSILKFSADLKHNPIKGLKWKLRYYPQDDHASVPLIAAYDALRFVFCQNKFPENQPVNQFFDKKYSAAEIKKMIIAHYQSLSQKMGYQVRPSEQEINNYGYTFLRQKDLERAEMFFQLNIYYYPQSFNTYDGLGDYFLSTGEKAMAAKYYKKALALKYREEIKIKLEKLEHGL